MSTVQTFQGMGVDQKLSSRVLAPPGGKCSDLFGSVDEPSVKTHKKTSDPFRAEVNSPLRSRQEPDTKHRLGLFENEAPADTPAEAVKETTDAPAQPDTDHNKENVHVADSEEEHSEEVKTVNGTETPEDEEKEKAEEPKRRVPPGGFSSKLW